MCSTVRAGFVLFVLLLFSQRSFAIPFDSDLCVTHYNIDMKPVFSENKAAVGVSVDVRNFSSRSTDEIEFFLCTLSDAKEIEVAINKIILRDGTDRLLPVEKLEIDSRSYFTIKLPKPLSSDEKCTIYLEYMIRGQKQTNCLPARSTNEDELYLISDFQWLPVVKYKSEPQRFPNICKPTWEMTLSFPDSMTGIVDGELVKSVIQNHNVSQKWRGIKIFAGSFCQFFLCNGFAASQG